MAACWRIRTVLRDPEMRRWSSSVWLRSYSRLMSTYVIIQKWPKGRNRWQTERLHVILVETSLHGLHLRLVCEQIVTVTNLSRHIQQLRYISKVGPLVFRVVNIPYILNMVQLVKTCWTTITIVIYVSYKLWLLFLMHPFAHCRCCYYRYSRTALSSIKWECRNVSKSSFLLYFYRGSLYYMRVV